MRRDILKKKGSNLLYLYNEGDENITITGGWTTGFDSGGTFTKNLTNFVLQTTDTAWIACVTSNTIDLTDWNTLKIEYEVVRTINHIGDFGYGGAQTAFPTTSNLLQPTSGKTISVLDISSVFTSEYIKGNTNRVLLTSGTVTFTIYKIWLEK